MTHTQTVALILDATRRTGSLFHTLTDTQREAVRVAGRSYAMAHATGKVADREAAEATILRTVGR